MRARLASHVHVRAARGGDERDAGGAAHMDDVQRAARFAREIEREADGFELHRDGARGEIVVDRSAVAQLRMIDFRMDRDEQVELGSALHSRAQRGGIGHRKIVDAAVRHERLEADDAGIAQRFEAVEIARHEPAPEREINTRLALGDGALRLERSRVNQRRRGVQRHIEEGGRAARGARA